jgi:hypothetical protein
MLRSKHTWQRHTGKCLYNQYTCETPEEWVGGDLLGQPAWWKTIQQHSAIQQVDGVQAVGCSVKGLKAGTENSIVCQLLPAQDIRSSLQYTLHCCGKNMPAVTLSELQERG